MDANELMSQEKQPRLSLAIVCAIGMGLAGCLLFGLLYFLGFIAWASGLVVVMAAAWGYQKFNLKMDKKGYVIITVIALVEMLLTILVSLNLEVYIYLVDQGYKISFAESTRLVIEVINESADVRSAVVVDAVLSVICVGVGVLVFYLIQRKKEKDEQLAQKAAQEAAELSEVGNSKVVLTKAGSDLLELTRVLRACCGVDLAKAKELAQSAPVTIKENISLEAANKIAEAVRNTGSSAEVE